VGIIFNLFLLSIGSIFGSVYLNKRYEEMLPMTVMTIIFTLFLFYMLDIALIGYCLILLVGATLTILSIVKFIKEKSIRKQAINNFFTPGLLIFAVLSLIIYLITKDNFVMLFDELRVWALYPKSIFTTNHVFGSGMLFGSDYYPGMPLFQYFFARNVGHFTEGHLYFSYALVVLSFLIPITKKIKWRNFWAIIPMIVLLFTFPMLFANSGFDFEIYYKTLFIDPILGVSFGYALFLSIQDLKNDKFKYVLFCLALSMVILMKVVGIVLVGCVILSYLFNQLFIYKSYRLKLLFKKASFRDLIKLVIPIIVVVFTFFSWQVFIRQNTNVVRREEVSMSRVSDSLQLFFNPTIKQKEFIKSYTTYIKNSTILYNQNSYSLHYTIPNVSIFFLIIMGVLFFSVVKERKKIIVSSTVFCLFSIFVFLLFYLYIDVFNFNYTIICYERYISAVMEGVSIFTLLLLFDMSYKIKNIQLYYFLLASLVLIYIYNIPKVNLGVYKEEVEAQTNNFADEIISSIGRENKDAKVLTVYNYCDTNTYSCLLYQHHLFLSLVDDKIYPDSTGIYIANTTVVFSPFTTIINNDNINSYLKDYDYAFVVENIENISPAGEKLFGSHPKTGDFFKKIVDKDGNISMEKINSY
jgi:hypothetical protein